MAATIVKSTTTYKEPEWSVRPVSSLWMLTEIKNGVEVAKHDLFNRATTIFGRATDQVHIVLYHESNIKSVGLKTLPSQESSEFIPPRTGSVWKTIY